jgi:hypothetical protein
MADKKKIYKIVVGKHEDKNDLQDLHIVWMARYKQI